MRKFDIDADEDTFFDDLIFDELDQDLVDEGVTQIGTKMSMLGFNLKNKNLWEELGGRS